MMSMRITDEKNNKKVKCECWIKKVERFDKKLSWVRRNCFAQPSRSKINL